MSYQAFFEYKDPIESAESNLLRRLMFGNQLLKYENLSISSGEVTIEDPSVIVDGSIIKYDETITVEISDGVTYDRIDRIVVQYEYVEADSGQTPPSIVYLQGTSAGAQAVTDNQTIICEVDVPSGTLATSLTIANVRSAPPIQEFFLSGVPILTKLNDVIDDADDLHKHQNYEDLISDSHTQNTDTGTTSSTFQINSSGDKIIIDTSGLTTSRTVDAEDIYQAGEHHDIDSGNPHNVTLSDVGGTTDHTSLSNIGTKSHAQIDSHINDTSTNPHNVTLAQLGSANHNDLDNIQGGIAGQRNHLSDAELGYLPSSSQKNAMDNSNSPATANPFATMNDLTAISGGSYRAPIPEASDLPGDVASEGVSISSGTTITDITGVSDTKFDISVDGEAPAVEVTLDNSGKNTGNLIATELQTKINAASANSVTVSYLSTSNRYYIMSDATGSSSSVVITDAAADSIADELKLGETYGGIEETGVDDNTDLDKRVALEENSIYQWEETPSTWKLVFSGSGTSSIDHGSLAGLGDDDHPQYLLETEHDAIGDSAPHHAPETPAQVLSKLNSSGGTVNESVISSDIMRDAEHTTAAHDNVTRKQSVVTGLASGATHTFTHSFGMYPTSSIYKKDGSGNWIDGLSTGSIEEVTTSAITIRNDASSAVDYMIVVSV